MRKYILITVFATFVSLGSTSTVDKVNAGVQDFNLTDASGHLSYKGIIPSEEDMANALKEALQVGSTNAANALHKPGGYLDNPLIKIPFPPDAIIVANKLRSIGMGPQVDKFIETLNRAAEDAAIKAAPIFIDAIKSMTLTDAKNILLGPDNSATMYFKGKTTGALSQVFSPVIKGSLDKTDATKHWTEITRTYNRLPFVKPVQTDLVKYATGKALDGLFLRVADEEKNIRKNSGSQNQVTDNLKKVFGWADGMK